MKPLIPLLCLGLLAFSQTQAATSPTAPANSPSVETIVCIRHGEKPPGGLGQLTPQGLNRSLALPKVLLAKYGTPQFIFAPNPTQKVDGRKKKGGYYYIRPLATIEPTAILCGLPVNTQFGYREIQDLEAELRQPEYKNAIVFVAWEHNRLDEFVRNLVKTDGGDVSKVHSWPDSDYDTIFVVKITRTAGGESLAFSIDHEGLDNLSKDYP